MRLSCCNVLELLKTRCPWPQKGYSPQKYFAGMVKKIRMCDFLFSLVFSEGPVCRLRVFVCWPQPLFRFPPMKKSQYSPLLIIQENVGATNKRPFSNKRCRASCRFDLSFYVRAPRSFPVRGLLSFNILEYS